MKPNTMYDIYPLTIIFDRYTGAYSGGKFTAWNLHAEDLPEDISGSDIPCMTFWEEFRQGVKKTPYYNEKVFCGFGETPDEALEDLFKEMTAE